MRYRDRAAAGRALATHLRHYAGRQDAIVLALPRGGVPVGFEIARALALPLDVILVRKLGAPGREELAMGAVATGGFTYVDRWMVQRLEISESEVRAAVERERRELARREAAYRSDRAPRPVTGKIVICVDDGLATGASMKAAVSALREGRPAKIVVAVPVAAAEVAAALREIADEVVVGRLPSDFRAVSLWYDDFTQTTDEEVRGLLAESAANNR